jgi:hypothetical protein
MTRFIGADVIPLQYCGVSDTDLSWVSTNELMMYALANIADEKDEGGYVVRHVRNASDFGRTPDGKKEAPGKIPLMAAYPCLWPYGKGGIECDRPVNVRFGEHTRWALQYHDHRFRMHHSFPFVAFGVLQKWQALGAARVQMRRQDFESDSVALATLKVADLKQAEVEEERKLPVSNSKVKALRKHVYAASGCVIGSDNSRAGYRGQIWGTILLMGSPSLWITVNPANLHDPIVQVFAGEEIDMDSFLNSAGPSADRRALNVAKDPYAAAKYFNFIIHTMLASLFGITVTKDRVHSRIGILGRISGYFGVVEAQGWGTLHLHMLIWLANAPNADEMHELLQQVQFREKIVAYIRQNVRSHIDNLTEESIRMSPREAQLAYSRPPNPDSMTWEEDMKDMEYRVA